VPPLPVENWLFCTFSENVIFVYKKVKQHFANDLCSVVVIGRPLVIDKHGMEISDIFESIIICNINICLEQV